MKFFYKEKMTNAEKNIARYIEANTGNYLGYSISTLAKKCYVSSSMVTKFCKSMGFSSYKSMQIDISNKYGQYKVSRINGDDEIKIISKTIGSFVKYGIDNVINELESNNIRAITSLINNSKQIFAFAKGSSKYAASNTVNRLRVLGKNAIFVSNENDITLWGNREDWKKILVIIYSYSCLRVEIHRMISFLEKNNIFYIIITTNMKIEQKNRNLIVNFKALEENENTILNIFSPKISMIVISDIIIEVLNKLYDFKKIKQFKL